MSLGLLRLLIALNVHDRGCSRGCGTGGRQRGEHHMFVLMLSEEHALKSAEDTMLMTTDVNIDYHHLERTNLPERKDTCLQTDVSYMGCIAYICCAVLLTAL